MKKMKKLIAAICAFSIVIQSGFAYASGNVNETNVADTYTESETQNESSVSQSDTYDWVQESETMVETDQTSAETESLMESQTEESQTEETQTEETQMEESQTEETAESEMVADADRLENSWRYTDGHLSSSSSRAASVENAWKNVNGNYVNNLGDVIPGAIARGIDVSEWQGQIDWQKVKNDDISFAIIRSGRGQTYKDKYWERNVAECTRLGIPFGTYLYSLALSPEDAIKEADSILKLVQGADLSYPIYYDVEDSTIQDLGNDKIKEIVEAFCSKVEAAGYNVQIYANSYWWNTYLTDPYFDRFEGSKWVAQWAPQCTYKGGFEVWQCTDQGRVDGIGGYVDINMLYTEKYDKAFAVKRFVTRLYELVLDRKPDKQGLQEWVDVLINKKTNGAEVVRDFIYSKEFINRNVSDEEYIEILYNTCLNRKPDNSGMQAWLDRFEDGFSRMYVLRGFIESVEFTKICTNYGINRGSIKVTEYRDQNDGITKYVTRCYKMFLDRKPDIGGLNDWARVILTDKKNAKTLPDGFIFSKEFLDKNVSDEDFVKICYKAILDREADSQGLNAWVKQLKNGQTRKQVLAGFTDSVEFNKLLSQYGL